MNLCRKLLHYGVALGTTTIALLLTFLLAPFLTQSIDVFFFVAITVTTWYSGLKSGFVAIVLSTLTVNYFFVPPLGQFTGFTTGDVIRFVVFSLVGIVIHTISPSLKESQQRIRQLSQQLLDESADRLKLALNEAQTSQALLQQQFEQQRLVIEITQRIRQSLNLGDILQTTVDEVRQLLQTDRVVIFRFLPDWRGVVAVESCGANWTAILSTEIHDPCFGETYVEPFKQGLVTAKTDIYTAGIGDCHLELLSRFQVKANLVVPIMKGKELWGLLIAHHCAAPRHWQDSEINLLRQIASQVGIALQQSALFEQVQTELVERKQAEAALQQSESRLRLAQVASNSGVWDWDMQQNIFFWSPEYYQLYGLEPTFEASYENWLQCIYPDDRQKVDQQTQQVLAGDSTEFRVEFRVLRSNQVRWFAGIGQVVRDEAGQPTRMIGIALDITQQKQTEIALQDLNTELERRVMERTQELNIANEYLILALDEEYRAKQEMEDLYNNAPCGYHSLNLEGLIVRINNTELGWLGYTRDEVLNQMKFIDLMAPESQPTFHQNFPRLIQEGWVSDLEFQLRCKDGSTRWVNLNAIAVKDNAGNFVMSRSSMFDITDRKRAESQLQLELQERQQTEAVLREAERRWQLLLENVQLIVVGLDISGRVEYINPFFLELTEYQLNEVLGTSWFDHFIHPNQRQALKLIFQEILEHALHPHHQNSILTKSGEERMIAWSNTLLQDTTGNVIGVISIGEDITERDKIDQMKAEFISMVSHELRTPLTSMQAALSLLNEKIIDPLSEEGEATIQIATDGTDRLVRLVNDILDLERLEAGKMRLEKHLYNISDLVNAAMAQMQEMAKQAEVSLEANLDPVQAVVDGDRLIQVLINLLSNAIKFSAPGSVVRLFVVPQPSETNPSFLLFMVQDEGRGIPADKLEHIFDRFHQVDASDSREKGGTGLGLAICRSIVQQHGGEIWVESTVGWGSTFYFTIPMETSEIRNPVEQTTN